MSQELEKILNEIAIHNKKVCDSVSHTEAIDFSKTKKNWGSDVIPKEFWIDIEKNYKTKSGKIVILSKITLLSDNGKEYTYPVKGSIYTKKRNKMVLEYSIWSLDGRASVSCDESHNDLVLIR